MYCRNPRYIYLRKKTKFIYYKKNIKTTKPSSKLDHIKIKLFKILRNIKKISFKLDLLSIIRIYPVFHVLLLKPANNTTPTTIIELRYIDF